MAIISHHVGADGTLHIITDHTMSQSDMEYIRARDYQIRHNLSTTRSAIKARLKTWHKQQEQSLYEGASGIEGVEL